MVGSGVFSLSSSAEKWSLGLLVPRDGAGAASAYFVGEDGVGLVGLGCF